MRLELLCSLMVFTSLDMSPACAQSQAHRVITGEFQRFDVDNLGNLYAITRGNQLRKYTPGGDSVGVFNDVVKYGRLRTMDVSNPLRILLFYPDFGTILLLDRMLKPIDVIDLRRLSMVQVSAVATSYDNQCWVYDDQEARLRKLDGQGRVLLESPDLRMLMDEVPHPVFLSDQQGMVSMYDPLRGLYLFDLYGAFQQRIPLDGCTDIRVAGKVFEGRCDGLLMRYDLKTGRTSNLSVPVSHPYIRQIVFQNAGLYVMDKEGILRFARTTDTTY